MTWKEPIVYVTPASQPSPYSNSCSFPLEDWNRVVEQARQIILDRDAKGRNDETPFYKQFPHGHQDVSFELRRRVIRILGAERRGAVDIMRADAIDLLNYAAFYLMVLDDEAKTT